MDKLRSIGKQSWESVESVAMVVWCILEVSCRTAAAASILHCNPKNEDWHRVVLSLALMVTLSLQF